MKKILILVFILSNIVGFSQTQKKVESKNEKTVNKTVKETYTEKNIEVEENSDDVYSAAGIEVQPEYIGGINKFYTDFNKEFKLKVENKDIRGRVYIDFIVEKNGAISDINIIRDLPSLNTGKKIIEIISKMPKWKPGMQDNKPIRARFTIAIILDIKKNTDNNSYFPS